MSELASCFTSADDPYALSRFVEAQEPLYRNALAEIQSGHKQTHWMWFIFPQIDGLGFSSMARKYAIKNLSEAEAYLSHSLLGARLRECSESLLDVDGSTAHQILGSPDDMKLKSSMTLFARIAPDGSPFHQVLDKYFAGQQDERTLELING